MPGAIFNGGSSINEVVIKTIWKYSYYKWWNWPQSPQSGDGRTTSTPISIVEFEFENIDWNGLKWIVRCGETDVCLFVLVFWCNPYAVQTSRTKLIWSFNFGNDAQIARRLWLIFLSGDYTVWFSPKVNA